MKSKVHVLAQRFTYKKRFLSPHAIRRNDTMASGPRSERGKKKYFFNL